ncbi:hypothetical protein J7E62_21060 [Variovorax paradoxus]|nr:hypothetical protein [Variovorax paradoxus]
MALASAAWSTQAAEIELEGNRLLVNGMLDGRSMKAFAEHLASGKVRTVVFENSFGGTAEAAVDFARAIRASGVNTEAKGQCHAACAYAFLAGKEHRFGRGFQVNALLIPVAARPRPEELASRWRGEEANRTLAELTAAPSEAGAERWQPDHGVLFTSTPTLFGHIYNSFYCDGTQGRDTSRCEVLSDADPYKLGVLTP